MGDQYRQKSSRRQTYTVFEALDCQEIGLVALMFFFELLFSYVSLAISLYVPLC